MATLLAVRYLSVHAVLLSTRKGLLSAQRIFLFGAGRLVNDFISKGLPKAFGVSVAAGRARGGARL
jgi:hypothetical protein